MSHRIRWAAYATASPAEYERLHAGLQGEDAAQDEEEAANIAQMKGNQALLAHLLPRRSLAHQAYLLEKIWSREGPEVMEEYLKLLDREALAPVLAATAMWSERLDLFRVAMDDLRPSRYDEFVRALVWKPNVPDPLLAEMVLLLPAWMEKWVPAIFIGGTLARAALYLTGRRRTLDPESQNNPRVYWWLVRHSPRMATWWMRHLEEAVPAALARYIEARL